MNTSEITNYIIDWNEEKNKWLKKNRDVSFEAIALKLVEKEIIDIIIHSSVKYSHQYILLVNLKEYIYAVPFVVDTKNVVIFLKTIIPTRKYTKKYLKNRR